MREHEVGERQEALARAVQDVHVGQHVAGGQGGSAAASVSVRTLLVERC